MFTKNLLVATVCMLALWSSNSFSASNMPAPDEDIGKFHVYYNFYVGEKNTKDIKTDADLPENAIGVIQNHPVYSGAGNTVYKVPGSIAFLVPSEGERTKGGGILTNRITVRCNPDTPNCIDTVKKYTKTIQTVNEEYHLYFVTVDGIEGWKAFIKGFKENIDQFASIFPGLDHGKTLKNRDEGLYQPGNAFSMPESKITD